MPHKPMPSIQALGREASASFQAEAWSVPNSQLSLENNEVHVWRAALDQPPSLVRAFQELLSFDERLRASKFYFPKDRDKFIVARGALRSILGRYLFVAPAQLQFCYGPHGKPRLAEPSDRSSLRFNISHAHNLALFAFTRHRDIGIDLEYLQENTSLTDVADRFFSSREAASLRGLPPCRRTQGFFNCWTRKEAYIKATGDGLSMPLNQFTVSLAPGDPAALLHTSHFREASRWSLRELTPDPDYVAAIVVEGSNWDLKCWQWGHGPQSLKLLALH